MATATSTEKSPAEKPDYVKRSTKSTRRIVANGRPTGPTREWTIARGHYKHAKWGPAEQDIYNGKELVARKGTDVVIGFVELFEGDTVNITEDERIRMDPKGKVFVTAKRYQQLKQREELEAEERREALALIAQESPDAKPPKSPADIMPSMREDRDAPDIRRANL